MTVKAIIKKTNGRVLVNRSGKGVVYLQYGHNGTSFLMSSGVYVSPLDWDPNTETVIGSRIKTQAIQETKSFILSTAFSLYKNNIEPTCHEVKKSLSVKPLSDISKLKEMLFYHEKEVYKIRKEIKQMQVLESPSYAKRCLAGSVNSNLLEIDKDTITFKQSLLKLKRKLKNNDKK